MQEEAWEALAWIRGALMAGETEGRLPEIFQALYPRHKEKLSEETQRLWMRYKITMLEEAFQSLRRMKERGKIAITDMIQQGDYRITAMQADGAAATTELDREKFPMPPFQDEGNADPAKGAGERAAGDGKIEGIEGVSVNGE